MPTPFPLQNACSHSSTSKGGIDRIRHAHTISFSSSGSITKPTFPVATPASPAAFAAYPPQVTANLPHAAIISGHEQLPRVVCPSTHNLFYLMPPSYLAMTLLPSCLLALHQLPRVMSTTSATPPIPRTCPFFSWFSHTPRANPSRVCRCESHGMLPPSLSGKDRPSA